MLKFILYGKKLRGKWVLVRMGGRAAKESKPNWLLIKEHDEYERKPDDPAITEEAPDSVATKRDLEAIARDEDHVWNSNRPERAPAEKRPCMGGRVRGSPRHPSLWTFPGSASSCPTSSRRSLPHKLRKLPAERSGSTSSNSTGIAFRRICSARNPPAPRCAFSRAMDSTGPTACRRSRNELERLKIDGAILDGEVVVLTESGETSFAALQAAFDESKPSPLTYFVFDLLHLNGYNLRNQPLIQRKQLLADLVETLPPDGSIRLSEHVEGNGRRDLRGSLPSGRGGHCFQTKRGTLIPPDGVHPGSRSSAFAKQEFVIGGFTSAVDGAQNRSGASALCCWDIMKAASSSMPDVPAPVSRRILSRKLRERLEALRRPKPAFAEVPPEARRGAVLDGTEVGRRSTVPRLDGGSPRSPIQLQRHP